MPILSRALLIVSFLIGVVDASSARQLMSESSQRYKLVRSVFENIIQAVGDGRTAPQLAIWSKPNPEDRVAWYLFDGTTATINIEESAVSLCLGFGADSLDALAVLLGHELAHFYRADTIARDFPHAFASAPLYGSIKERASRVELVAKETDADLFGGFYGYLAGYNTLGVNARVLDKIYTYFELPDTLPGYLTLGERQAIARSTRDSLRKLIPVVDAGTSLFALGNYAESGRCFDLVLQKFPSREMFNNAGVARALQAIQISQPPAMPFPYPFEFDVDMRLRSLESGRTRRELTEAEAKLAEYRSKLLLAAGEDFKQALKRDQSYATALVNLSCILDLLGGHELAIAKATDAIALAKRTNDIVALRNAYQIRCIAYLGKKDSSKANADSRMVAPYHERVKGAQVPTNVVETIASSKASGFVIDRNRLAALVPADPDGSAPIRIYSEDLDNSRALLVECDKSKLLTIETFPGYSLESFLHIKIGSRRAELENRYGSPTSVRATSRGECLVFENAKICFWLGADDRVQGWMIYQSKD